MRRTAATERKRLPSRSFDMCTECDKRLREGREISVGVCFNCARHVCDCMLTVYKVEGERERKSWCADDLYGGCNKEPDQ